MPRSSTAAVALAGALLVSPAFAEPPYPTVDFEGEWVMTDGQGLVMRAEVRYLAGQRKMRIDMRQQGVAMSTLRDMASGNVITWSEQIPGMAMRMPTAADEDRDGEQTSETRTVDGEDCAVWRTKTAQLCLTDDNIPLEVTTDEGVRTALENLQRTAQDPALFELPAGFLAMDLCGGHGSGPYPGKGLPY